MRKDKQNALELRKYGKSYNQIKALLGIPKSTLSGWLQSVQWSDKIKQTLSDKEKLNSSARLQKLDAVRGKHYEKLYNEARKEAQEEFEYFKYYPLFIAGICLYWGEGNKASKYNVTLGNTDPLMIKIFANFLRTVCGVPEQRIRAYILLYPDLDEKTCSSYWIKNTGLSKSNFTKSILIQGRHKSRRVQYGVCTINLTSRYIKEKILLWLNLLSQDLIKPSYTRL